MERQRTFKVAAAQIAPVFLNREATVEKACEYIREAASHDARLVVFPETFIPTYPDWVWAIPPGEGGALNDLYVQLLDNSVAVPSPTTDRLCEVAREAGIFIVMGINELDIEASGGTIYNSIIYINDQGRILGKHRKLVPTSAERMIWGQGDGSTLEAYDTSIGTLGGLICWENYMPLARYAMYAWGTELYVASTWDTGDGWTSTLRHIAREGRTYVIGCCIPMRKIDIPDGLRSRFYADADEWINPGGSAIVGPDGTILAGPVVEKEEILYADVDLRKAAGGHRSLDVAGHYARPDVFELILHRGKHPMLRISEGESADRVEVETVLN
jgi:nitrilase